MNKLTAYAAVPRRIRLVRSRRRLDSRTVWLTRRAAKDVPFRKVQLRRECDNARRRGGGISKEYNHRRAHSMTYLVGSAVKRTVRT